MNQRDLRDHLADYADGELDAELRSEIDRHLAESPEARDEVSRWQALRRSAGRALADVPVPPGLAQRVRAGLSSLRDEAGSRPPTVTGGARPRSRFPTVYRLGLSGTAIAAGVVLVILLWPRPVKVEAAGFVDVYRRCAINVHHDTLNIRGGTPWADFQRARGQGSLCQLRSAASFACRVPDLTARGYRLEGACECSPRQDVKVVHAYFRRDDVEGAVVSVFNVAEQVTLVAGGKACPQRATSRRKYQTGAVGPVSLLAWEDGKQSFVLVSEHLDAEGLVDMVDGLALARINDLQALTPVALASTGLPSVSRSR